MSQKDAPALPAWLRHLFRNSRFWILAVAITASVNIAGFVQFLIPDGTLQTIRIEQIYGFVSLGLLYTAIIISPITKVFPKLPARDAIIHARRAIGVSAFYFAALHTLVTFFGQLNGFAGIAYLNPVYSWSLGLGVFALAVLCMMAATSLDVVVAKMGYKHWKLLHRLVYFASLALLGHVLLIGPHFDNGLTFLGALTYAAALLLVVLEVLRIRIVLKGSVVRNVAVLVAALILAAAFPAIASAHVLKTDGDMGAILHILPDDAPVANVPVTYVVSFQTSERGFDVPHCDCSVTYQTGDSKVTRPLTPSGDDTSRNTYTFSKAAVYTFTVAGKPKDDATFTPFTLHYVVRVGGDRSDAQPIPPLLWAGLAMVVALVLLYTYIPKENP